MPILRSISKSLEKKIFDGIHFLDIIPKSIIKLLKTQKIETNPFIHTHTKVNLRKNVLKCSKFLWPGYLYKIGHFLG